MSSLDKNRAWVRHWVKLGRDSVLASLRQDEAWADSGVREGDSDWRSLARWSGEARGLRAAVMLDEPWVTES